MRHQMCTNLIIDYSMTSATYTDVYIHITLKFCYPSSYDLLIGWRGVEVPNHNRRVKKYWERDTNILTESHDF